jgi:Stigma-specific protein, Stig1
MADQVSDRSFDELARGLASGSISRGKALKLMGAALVGSALASVPGMAWARGCPQGQTRCGGRCVNLKTNENHCGSCANHCRSTQTCCKGRCVNLQINENHCGSCRNRCAEGQECVHGSCEPICGPTNCAGCCDSNGVCQPGTENTACGINGEPCIDCMGDACGEDPTSGTRGCIRE